MFFLGYAGTALGFMLPSAREFLDTEYINKEQSDADIMLSAPEGTLSGKHKHKGFPFMSGHPSFRSFRGALCFFRGCLPDFRG
jgi:hypothetical protein